MGPRRGNHLTYVIIHIWDDRRSCPWLFSEKSFHSRGGRNPQGAQEIIEQIRFGTNVLELQVTDARSSTAADSSKSWDLRCDIREKLIAYIQQQPRCAPNEL